MKCLIHQMIWLLILFLLLETAQAELSGETLPVLCSGDFYYSILDDGSAEITGCSGYDRDSSSVYSLTIPDALDGHPVVYIGDYAFANKRLASVRLPSGLKTIGKSAFATYWLSEITLPDSLETIGEYAFSHTNLTEINLPDCLREIGIGAFAWCKLTNITLSQNHPVFEIIDRLLFNKSDRSLVYCLQDPDTTHVDIPAGTVSIGEYAFANMNNLTSITLQEGLQYINPFAFYRSGLTEIILPDSLEEIGDSAFALCRELKVITLSKHLRSIGENAFYNCFHLTDITLPEGLESLGDNVFYGTHLSRIRLPDSLKYIDGNPFIFDDLIAIEISENHPTLEFRDQVLFDKEDGRLICYPSYLTETSYSIPQGTRIIGKRAFNSKSESPLQHISIPDSVIAIDDEAFIYCTALMDIDIPGSVHSIGNRAFACCDSMTSITLHERLVHLGADVFENCLSLEAITLPDSLYSFNGNPFTLATALKTINISDHNPYLMFVDNALISKSDCRLISCLTTATEDIYMIPEGTEIIGSYSFCLIECNTLSFVLPDTVTTIESGAFSYGEHGKHITIRVPANVIRIEPSAFVEFDDLTLIVDSGSTAETYCQENRLHYILAESAETP